MAGPKRKSTAAGVRLLPAAMVTVAAVLGLKAVAMAEGVAEANAEAAHGEEAPAQAASSGAPASTALPANCAPATLAELTGLSQAEVQVLQALGARREALDQLAAQSETQDALMAAAEQRLQERVAELRQLEAHVNELLGNLDEAQERRLTELVNVYQRMRAKDAAAVFNGLEDEVLLQVASRMREQNLAEVLGRMEPDRARTLTRMLAVRAQPPADGQALLAQSGSGAAAAPARGR